MSCALIVLAAGQGSRMNSDLPKVLHPIGGAPLIAHALRAGAGLEPDLTIVVTGHGADLVEAQLGKLDPELRSVRQNEQFGTGHAALQAKWALEGFEGDAVVLYGDTPFVRSETLIRMREARAQSDVVVLGFEAANPGRYGRLVTDGDELTRIVEAKDATPEELSITLCNSGVLMADATTLMTLLDRISNNNAQGEYYLTDVPELARQDGMTTSVVTCDEAETLGINTRAELAAAEKIFQSRARAEAFENGVTLADPATTYFSLDTFIGRDTEIGPNVVFGPGVTIETGVKIRAFCHLEDCHVSRGATVGPFARLRPGAELSENTHIGNFVEIKNATVAEGAKVNHLTYVGDASIGARSNIGAGTVTCNYDGVFKHRTEIGEDVFIGSDTMLVAPVRIGDGAMTGSGSVITSDVPDGALALGRARQENKQGFATRLMRKLKAAKARKAGKVD